MPLTSLKSVPEISTPTPSEVEVLPLAPIEKFLLNNDAPEHPIVFRVLLKFRGSCQADKLSEAFRIAAGRQPLLRSLIVGTEADAAWQLSEQIPELEWNPFEIESDAIPTLPIEPIDLRKSVGLRGRIWRIGEEITILLDVHHACCDGQGARQFLAEWLQLYSKMSESESLKLARLAHLQLQDRAYYKKPNPPIGTLEGLKNLYLTVRGKTVRLPEKLSQEEQASGPNDFLAEYPLTIEQTTKLRQTLKRHKLSVNDLGLAASFATMMECYPEAVRRGYITILHPVDLRTLSDLKTPACNRVGVTFLRRRKSQCRSPEQLLKSVRNEMTYIKKRYVGAEFLRGLASADSLPGGTARIQRGGWFVPTLQFTCLGDTTRALHYRLNQVDGVVTFGEMKMQRISGFMQLGPFVPLSLAACETNQRLSFTLRSNARYLSREDTDRFLSVFVEKFLEFEQLHQ